MPHSDNARFDRLTNSSQSNASSPPGKARPKSGTSEWMFTPCPRTSQAETRSGLLQLRHADRAHDDSLRASLP
jgi:hypothetical protein